MCELQNKSGLYLQRDTSNDLKPYAATSFIALTDITSGLQAENYGSFMIIIEEHELYFLVFVCLTACEYSFWMSLVAWATNIVSPKPADCLHADKLALVRPEERILVEVGNWNWERKTT